MLDDLTRAAALLRQLADELTCKTPGNVFCAELGAKARKAADHLDASRAPPVRFFARIHAATLECPVCGSVIMFGQAGGDTLKRGVWDPVTARLKCYGCRRLHVLGVIAWTPLRIPGRQGAPEDQVPDDRQRAELRAQLVGMWVARRVPKHPQRTNVRMDEGCTCTPGAVGAGGCLIHPSPESESR